MPETEAVPPLLESPRSQAVFVESATELRAVVESLAQSSGPFAIDAERASGYKYFPRAYLIQIYRLGGPIYLIDPLIFDGIDTNLLSDFLKEVNSDEWILHAATQDLACLAEIGLKPVKLFDTELASRLLGLERVGLGAITETLLDLKLAKEHSAVDWSTRPLKPEWLNYAALDVDVLHELRAALISRLETQSKLEWALEEFDNLIRFKPKVKDAEKWRSVSGLHALKDRRKLAIVKAIWHAREELAQKLDVSPGRLIPDSSLIEVALQEPKTRAELMANKKFAGRASRSYSDLWWHATEEGNRTNDLPELKGKSGAIPHHRFWKQKHPEAFRRLEESRVAMQRLSEENLLPSENILAPDLLRQLCWDTELHQVDQVSGYLLNAGARSWQVQLVGESLSEALSSAADPSGESQS